MTALQDIFADLREVAIGDPWADAPGTSADRFVRIKHGGRKWAIGISVNH